MGDTSLNTLSTRHGGFVGVRDDVDERDAVQADHLLKIDVPVLVPVHVVGRHAKVGSVRVRLEDVAPRGRGRLGDRDVQEHRPRARLEDGVRLRKGSGERRAGASGGRAGWSRGCLRTCCSSFMLGGNMPVANVLPSSETCKSSECLAAWYYAQPVNLPNTHPRTTYTRLTSATIKYSENLANPTT